MKYKYAVLWGFFVLLISCSKEIVPQKDFPIMVGFGAVPQVLSQTDFDHLAAAGFTHVVLASGHAERNQRLLTFTDSTGLKAFIQDDHLNDLLSADSLRLRAIDSVVNRYTQHASFQGFYVAAKPHIDELFQLKKACAALRKIAPDYPPYINLYAHHDVPVDYGAADIHRYYSAVMDSLELDVIHEDNYGVKKDELTTDFFHTLVALRNISEREHKPFWGYALTLDFYHYPVPRHSFLRGQLYSALAFGAKGVQYSHFHPPEDTRRMEYGDAMTDEDGNLTRVYHAALELNKDLATIGGILQDLDFLYAYHTIPSPLPELQWRPGLWVEKVDGHYLTGFFTDDADKHYALFVNMDLNHGHDAEIIMSDKVKRVFQVDKQTGAEQEIKWFKAGNYIKVLFQAGDAELLRLEFFKTDEDSMN